jgi:hypothetical protein
MIPQLTDDMRQALADQQGQPVYVIDPATQQTYVLLSADAYQKVQALIYDDGEPNLDEFMALAHDAFADDWNAPGMEAYDQLENQDAGP